MSSKYSILVDLVLGGARVSREMADLVVAGSEDAAAPAVELFACPPADLESLISASLDAEFGVALEVAA